MTNSAHKDLLALSAQQRRSVLQSLGLPFVGENVVIQLGGGSTFTMDENLFIDPSPQDWQAIYKEINQILGQKIELFDIADKNHERVYGGERVRQLGRIFDHDEYVCCPVKQRRYYNYLELRSPEGTSDTDWNTIAQFAVCVVGTIGLAALISVYVPGGRVIIDHFAALVFAVAAGCVALLHAASPSSKQTSYIHTYNGR